MQFCITFCFLLVGYKYILIANSARVELKAEDEGLLNATAHEGITGKNRWKLETADFQKGLKMMNDNGELVELTTDVIPPRGSASRNTGDSVSFFLYTRKNRKRPQELFLDYRSPARLKKTNLNPKNPTVFITHGWISNQNSSACTLIRNAYTRIGNMNVIVVDWSTISFASYQWGVRKVRSVAKQVAMMIDYLETNNILQPEQTTLVGHSLGAHIMGVAAYQARATINTVFGLDPAYPMFKHAGPGSRISIYDARHVQIIHTNAGSLGYYEPIGRSDFYPNGGATQVGCGTDLLYVCSHSRATELFAESLTTSVGFYGKPCTSADDFLNGACHGPNVAMMGGLDVNPTLQGVFYLRTKAESPYALGLVDE